MKRFIVIRFEFNGFLFDVFQHLASDPVHANLGVSHGCRRVSVHGPEVSLSVNHRVSHGKILSEPNDGLINRSVSMGVILTDDITHDPGAFPIGSVPEVPLLIHGKEHPSVNRLQTVPDVRQSPSHDHAHGVIQIAPLHFVFDVHRQFLSIQECSP